MMVQAAFHCRNIRQQQGFTLLEVMIVLLLMGLAATYVVFNVVGTDPVDELETQARRLQVVTDMASDYAVMNQQQMGIRFEPDAGIYYFVFLDEQNEWQRLEDNNVYAERQLPEPFFLSLNLDNLPWNQDSLLYDREIFDEDFSLQDTQTQIGSEEDAPLPPPQVLIMSSGEITPFVLTFHYEPGFGSDVPAYFQLKNEALPPLELTGPLEQIPQ